MKEADPIAADGLELLELDKLVDSEQLTRLLLSCYELTRVPLRLFSATGTLVAEYGERASLCEYVCETASGRQACRNQIADVKRETAIADRPTTVHCFTSARYKIVPVEHAAELGGRLVIGPYRCSEQPGNVDSAMAALRETVPELSAEGAIEHWQQMVELSPQRAAALAEHLRTAIETVVASGYDAQASSHMHLAATRESYAQLEQRNQQLQDANERLRELDGLKTSFLHMISHELRTPLTSILGYGEMLLNELAGPLADEQRDFIRIIQRQGDQLLKLIMSLLDVAKLEQGSVKLSKDRLDIFAVLQDVVATLTPVALDKGIFVDLNADERKTVPSVSGDPDRIRQVFLNLLENALKFSKAGDTITLTPTVAGSVHQDEVGYILFAPLHKQIQVSVADTGPGVPERSRTRIFDAFYQLDHSSTREHSGTGLGLTIVKRLVQAHGGSIRVEKNKPRGAVFIVNLPAWNEPPDTDPSP